MQKINQKWKTASWVHDWRTDKGASEPRGAEEEDGKRDSIRTKSRAHTKVWQLAHVLCYREKKMPLGYTVLSRNNEQNEMSFTHRPSDLFKIGSKFFTQCLVGREFCLKSNNMHYGPCSELSFSARPRVSLFYFIFRNSSVSSSHMYLSVILSHFFLYVSGVSLMLQCTLDDSFLLGDFIYCSHFKKDSRFYKIL